MREKTRNVGVGTMSLVMIFAVLCLTVFSMLTLSAANAEKVLAEKKSSFVKTLYEADSRAVRIRARVVALAAAGAPPVLVDGVEIHLERPEPADANIQVARYVCPVGDTQELFIRFVLDGAENQILNWELRLADDWEPDESVTIWDGGSFD